jgi:hypothetical protein
MRLNTAIRKHVLDKLRTEKFDPIEKEINAEQHALADRVYAHLYTEEERALMLTLPDGWLKSRGSVDVRVDGHYHNLEFDNEEFRRFPYGRETIYLSSGHPIGRSVTAWARKLELHKEARKEALQQAAGALASYSTVGALLKAWPQVEPFLPPNLEKVTTALAISVKQLNRLLRLP